MTKEELAANAERARALLGSGETDAMDKATPAGIVAWHRSRRRQAGNPTDWRPGESVPENLYDADPDGHGGRPGRHLGFVRTPELAQRIAEAVNGEDRLARYLLTSFPEEWRLEDDAFDVALRLLERERFPFSEG